MQNKKVVYLQDYIFARGERVPSSDGVIKSQEFLDEVVSLSTQGITLVLWMMAINHTAMAVYYQRLSLEFLTDSRQAFYRFPQFVD